MNKNFENTVVVVTGASSGFGLELVKMYIANNFKVYGVAIDDFKLDGLNYIKSDVRDFSACKKIIDDIVEKEGKIDIMINNAGMGISGPVEFTKVEDAHRIMDVNFFGAFNFIKATLPHFRKQGYGRIVNTSSIASFVPIPFQAFYSASKAALDSLAAATRSETYNYNIKIVNVLPGDAKTGFTSARKKVDGEDEYPQCKISVQKMEKDEHNGMPPIKIAKVIYKVSTQKRPPLRRLVGGKYKFLCFILSLLPRKLREYAVRKFY